MAARRKAAPDDGLVGLRYTGPFDGVGVGTVVVMQGEVGRFAPEVAGDVETVRPVTVINEDGEEVESEEVVPAWGLLASPDWSKE